MATILVFNFLKAARQVEGRYVIARTNISKGDLIQEQDVGLSNILKKVDAKRLFHEVEDVVGQRALEDISQGSLIYRSKVTRREVKTPTPSAPQKKALPIPAGMRALTLSRQNIINIPDLLNIGSYVDIIGLTPGEDEQKEMHTLVSSCQVISISPLDGSAIESVTVAVMPNEAEMVLQSATLKQLQLLVREDRAEQRMFEAPRGSVEIIRGVQKEGVFGKR